MCIAIDFICRNGIAHHVEGMWPSLRDATDWARRVFGASDSQARPL